MCRNFEFLENARRENQIRITKEIRRKRIELLTNISKCYHSEYSQSLAVLTC